MKILFTPFPALHQSTNPAIRKKLFSDSRPATRKKLFSDSRPATRKKLFTESRPVIRKKPLSMDPLSIKPLLMLMLFATIVWGVSGCHQPASNKEKTLRIAFIGDAEPKPLAEFPNMAEAVHRINQMHGEHPFDLVIGVGDIAHKGTLVQYEAATAVLTQLQPPLYPIMGNEEHDQSTERYLSYISKWNSPADTTKYTLEYDHVALIFASPDFGRDFSDEGAGWILEELRRIAPKPTLLIVHAAQAGVYPENPEKGVMNERFRNEVISQPNLSAVISGDLHMDMDRVQHSKKIGSVHYLHIPALERTKIPDETHHRPMVRVMTIQASGAVAVDTYALDTPEAPLTEHAYTFQLQPAASPSP